MFRSLFIRLMVTYFIIIIITLTALGFLLSGMFKDSYYEERITELRKEAQEINRLAEQNSYGLINDENFYYGLTVIARQLKASIWLVDRLGNILRIADPNQNTQWEGSQFSRKEFAQFAGEVLEGKEKIITGSFGQRFQVPVLTLGRPFVVSKRIIGAIFIHTQLQQMQQVYYKLYVQIWRSAILSGFLAIVLLSWTSMRLSVPLAQMNSIVREVARGNFDRRIKVKSKDEIGQLAMSFNYMAEELKGLEELRKGFVANVSHELRSPLTSVQGFIQGIVDGTIPQGEHQQYLNIVLDETKRLNKLISELLDLAQIESGKFPLHIEKFDINELIRRVLIKWEGKIDQKKLEVEVTFREEPLFVQADRDRVEQVISNLVDNAVKFSPQEGKITVWTHASNDKVFTSVQDSGPGIAEENLPFIWESFYKVDKAHTPGVDGTGLGLSIVKKIIDQHNQKIWAKGNVGKGAVFIFSLNRWNENGN